MQAPASAYVPNMYVLQQRLYPHPVPFYFLDALYHMAHDWSVVPNLGIHSSSNTHFICIRQWSRSQNAIACTATPVKGHPMDMSSGTFVLSLITKAFVGLFSPDCRDHTSESDHATSARTTLPIISSPTLSSSTGSTSDCTWLLASCATWTNLVRNSTIWILTPVNVFCAR